MTLLKHLEAVGFEGAPRPVGDGFDADGREAITYIPGPTPHPRAWDDHAIVPSQSLCVDCTMLRSPSSHLRTHAGSLRSLVCCLAIIRCSVTVIRVRGTSSPRTGIPVAFIDWEFAGPVDALWELAETAWLNAQLHDDDIAEQRWAFLSAARRSQQVRLLLDAYGLPTAERVGFVDRMIEFAVHSARAEAVRYGVTPDTATAVDPSGYPVLWAITWRARSASWMLRHRQILERALV